MEPRIAWVSLLIMAASLAGCTDDKDPVEATPTPTDIEVSLSADVTRGPAPLRVNLTLDGNASASASWRIVQDPDGAADEVQSGTGLPATIQHVLSNPGTRVLEATVEDGARNGTARVTITADAAQPQPNDPPTTGGGGNETGGGSGNETTDPGENVTAGPSDLVQVFTLEGTFTGGDTDAVAHTFEVPDHVETITMWADWEGSPVLTNAAYPNDIDLFLKAPGGTTVQTAETLGFEYVRHDGADGGVWTLEVLPYDVPFDTPYTVQVLLWSATPMEQVVEGTATGDVDLGEGIALFTHDVTLPDVQTVQVHLTWDAPESGACTSTATTANDLDFNVAAGGSEVLNSGYFRSCEYDAVDADGPMGKAGTWTLTVVPFYAVSTSYQATFLYV